MSAYKEGIYLFFFRKEEKDEMMKGQNREIEKYKVGL